MIDQLRRQNRQESLDLQAAEQQHDWPLQDETWFDDSELLDPTLGLMFGCCHPTLRIEDRIAITLKSLCGFGVSEVARGLLVPDEVVKKRIQRARKRLAQPDVDLAFPNNEDLTHRLHDVLHVLYLMFNEGYCSQSSEQLIREDVCEEAARLCHLLTESTLCDFPATRALLALMLFHAARILARQSDNGLVLLLEEQDRSKWDQRLIRAAREQLNRAAKGPLPSRYHLEAVIAHHHTEAESFESTDWSSIDAMYAVLERTCPSPIYTLNRAVVCSYLEGPEQGLQKLETLRQDTRLSNYHWLSATRGELLRRLGRWQEAEQELLTALSHCQAPAEQELLRDRLQDCRKHQGLDQDQAMA